MKKLFILRPGVRILPDEKMAIIPDVGIIPVDAESLAILNHLAHRPLFPEEVRAISKELSDKILEAREIRVRRPEALGADFVRSTEDEAMAWIIRVRSETFLAWDDHRLKLTAGTYLLPGYRPQLTPIANCRVEAVKASAPRKSREEWILKTLRAMKAKSLLELGCGESRSLEKMFLQGKEQLSYLGVDKDIRSEGHRIRCNFLDRFPQISPGTIAVAEEVIEHLTPGEVEILIGLLGKRKIPTAIFTTPNSRFTQLMGKKIRHPDHKFEWNWSEIRAWAREVEAKEKVRIKVKGIGRKWKGVYPTWGIIISFS